MQLNDFIKYSIFEIKKGIDDFNEKSNRVRAFYPESVHFEIFTDKNGYVDCSGTEKIVVDINLYNPRSY